MSFSSLDKKIWKMWRQGKSLEEMVKFVSDYTGWSGYISLVHITGYLYEERNVQLNRRTLRRAFNKTRDDFDREDEEEVWKFLLEKAGISKK